MTTCEGALSEIHSTWYTGCSGVYNLRTINAFIGPQHLITRSLSQVVFSTALITYNLIIGSLGECQVIMRVNVMVATMERHSLSKVRAVAGQWSKNEIFVAPAPTMHAFKVSLVPQPIRIRLNSKCSKSHTSKTANFGRKRALRPLCPLKAQTRIFPCSLFSNVKSSKSSGCMSDHTFLSLCSNSNTTT